MYESPFRQGTWIGCAVAIVLCGLAYYYSTKYGKIVEDEYDFDLQLVIMTMMHGALSQSINEVPKKSSTRAIFCVTYTIGTWD